MKTLMTHPPRRPPQRQRGAVAVLTGILIALLVGFGALVVDLGRLYVFKTELQNAMDACALAASGALNSTQNSTLFTDMARARGLAMLDVTKRNADGEARLANLVHFQRDALDLSQVRVEFSTSMGGPWSSSGNALTTQHVRCSYTDTGIRFLLARALNAFQPGGGQAIGPDMQLAAYAVATLRAAQRNCAIPLGICKASGTNAGSQFGLTPGQRLTAAGYGTGNFGWIDFTPPGGGATELADALKGEGNCSLSLNAPVGTQGRKDSLEQAWNTRFGIYSNNLKKDFSAAPPDFTGTGYLQGNSYSLYQTHSNAREPFQGKTNPSTTLTKQEHADFGKLRRRVAIVPVVDCSTWSSGNGSAQPRVEAFACVLMLAPIKPNTNSGVGNWQGADTVASVEYLGLADAANTPCASPGLPGGLAGGPRVPTLVQ